MKALISIIMPVYNAEKYLQKAIQSVLDQSHEHLELIIVNDGSTDRSDQIILDFYDPRILRIDQENKGVSAARNKGLDIMKGDFFCFLDADDFLPKNSLGDRLKIFERGDDIDFVDGSVQKFNEPMTKVLDEWSPNFNGNPLKDLIQLTGNSFFGPTWMIKNKNQKVRFNEDLSHGEDLWFFIQLSADGGNYAFTDEIILHYRMHHQSAMSNLEGLEKGYRSILGLMKQNPIIEPEWINQYKKKVRRIMFLSHIKRMELIKAIKSLI